MNEKKLGRISDYNKTLPVLELYTCLQSEGSRFGRPNVLIRTTGCTHRCYFGEGGWCDSWQTSIHPEKGQFTFNDIIKMYDGTTVEVLNTDAEGRMVLADALAYSDKFKPELVIDAATLTGAAVRAIGQKASCVMGNADKKYFQFLDEAGMETYERVVQLPFWDDYFDEMKSKIADLNNLGGGMAGMITAGKFLEHFVKAPYIHMDIAGPAYLEKPQDYRGLGGTGTGIRLLINFLKRLS
jgi:leucyl aminopeptidase